MYRWHARTGGTRLHESRDWLISGSRSMPDKTADGRPIRWIAVFRSKTAAKTRTLPVPLHDRGIEAWDNLFAMLGKERCATVADWLAKHRRSRDWLGKSMKTLGAKAGLDPRACSLYALRHGRAKDMADEPRWMAERAGG
jgi:hypothetical protein